MADRERADYFKERRKKIGQFSVSVPRGKLELLEEKLKTQGKKKTEWLNEKIEEEISK